MAIDGLSDDETGRTTKRTRRKDGVIQETVVTKRELTDDDDDDRGSSRPMTGGQATFATLFATQNDDENAVVRVRVIRSNPNEGMLGYIEDLDATELEILERWGGSAYRLEGVDSRGRITKVKSMKLAGDPVFVSRAAENEWKRMRGTGQPESTGMDAQAVLQMIEERETRRENERAEKSKAEAREREERAELIRKAEREFALERDRLNREADEKRRRDEGEREDRRRVEERERDERRKRDAEDSSRSQQQFMTQMLTILQASSQQSMAFVKETMTNQQQVRPTDPTEYLMKGIDLALKLRPAGGGGDEEDILTTVVKNLPDMLSSAGGAIGSAIREVRGTPSTPEGSFVLQGKAAERMSALAKRISDAGGNPDDALATIADRLLSAPAARPAAQPEAASPVIDKPVVFDIPPTPAPTPPVASAPAPASPPVAGTITRMQFRKP